jgi:hypothetical protein
MDDSSPNHQSPEYLAWGCAVLGAVAMIGMMFFCAQSCGQCGGSRTRTVEQFGDGNWELRSVRKGVGQEVDLYQLDNLVEWKVALSSVRDHAKQDHLVFFLTSGPGYAVLDLRTNTLQKFDRIEDAPAELRAALRKLRG